MKDHCIEMEYQLTPQMMKDGVMWATMRSVQQEQNSKWLIAKLLQGAAMALAVILFVQYVLPGQHPAVAVIAFGLGFFACVGISQRSVGRQINVIVDFQMRVDGGLTKLGAGPESLRISNPMFDNTFTWAAVDEVAREEDLIILRIGAVAYVIPVAAAPDGLGAEGIVEQFNAWRSE